MKLYILRHAIAEERNEATFPDDSLRPISEKGKKKMVRIAENLKNLGVQIDLILSSPYVRARETARITVKALGLEKNHLVLCDHLSPLGLAKDLIEKINESYWVDNLMLVGHEPYLSDLIALLVTGNSTMSIILKKGGLCRLSLDRLVYGKCATLEWLLTPAHLTLWGNPESG